MLVRITFEDKTYINNIPKDVPLSHDQIMDLAFKAFDDIGHQYADDLQQIAYHRSEKIERYAVLVAKTEEISEKLETFLMLLKEMNGPKEDIQDKIDTNYREFGSILQEINELLVVIPGFTDTLEKVALSNKEFVELSEKVITVIKNRADSEIFPQGTYEFNSNGRVITLNLSFTVSSNYDQKIHPRVFLIDHQG